VDSSIRRLSRPGLVIHDSKSRTPPRTVTGSTGREHTRRDVRLFLPLRLQLIPFSRLNNPSAIKRCFNFCLLAPFKPSSASASPTIPRITCDQVSKIVGRATGQYQVMFTALAASGLRISELLNLRIENVLLNGYRLRIVEKNYNGVQEDRLKTLSAERIVVLHSSGSAASFSHRKTDWWLGFRNSQAVSTPDTGR
jgi:integrase